MSGQPLSILLHSRAFYPKVGGLERVSEHLARELTNLGHQVTVLTDTPLGDAEELGPYRVVRSPAARTRRELVRGADIVHVNGFSVQLARTCLRLRKPLIWTHAGYQATCPEGNLLHGSDRCYGSRVRCLQLTVRDRGYRWAAQRHLEITARRFLLRIAAANVCVSAWQLSRVLAPRSRVIWNPVSLDGLGPGEKRQNRGCFAFFGRLVPEKGAWVLVQALARCRSEGQAFTVRIIGDGPERPTLEAMARQAGCSGAVRFEGSLTGSALRDAHTGAWVVVVPSVCEEAFGLVAAEAMASGTPLIVSRDGGLREVAGECALHFGNGEAAPLAAEMQRIASNESLWLELAARGPARARRFSAVAVAGRYHRLYEEVLA